MSLKRIRKCDVKILYCNDWYDGPLSGLCIYKGKYYHFECTGETYDKSSIMEMTYTVYKLPFDRLIYELMWHFDFVTNVNEGYTFDDKMTSSELFKKNDGRWRGDFFKRQKKQYIKLGKPPKLEAIGYFVE